jgi:hypothetical protein
VGLNRLDELRGLFTAHGFPPAQFADQVLTGFIDKTEYRAVAFFPPVFGIVALSSALLLSIERLNRCINVQVDTAIV